MAAFFFLLLNIHDNSTELTSLWQTIAAYWTQTASRLGIPLESKEIFHWEIFALNLSTNSTHEARELCGHHHGKNQGLGPTLFPPWAQLHHQIHYFHHPFWMWKTSKVHYFHHEPELMGCEWMTSYDHRH